MQSELEIRMRLTEVKGYLRNFENKNALDLEVSAEEYDIAENYVGERDALQGCSHDSILNYQSPGKRVEGLRRCLQRLLRRCRRSAGSVMGSAAKNPENDRGHCLRHQGSGGTMTQNNNSTKSRYHELKTAPAPFICVSLDQKRAEFRKNDRDFKVLDTLILREYDIFHGYTGSYELRYITHIQEGYGIPEGYVMLSIRPLTEREQAYHSAGIKERVCIRDCIQCNQNPEGHCSDDEPIEEQHRDVSQSS